MISLEDLLDGLDVAVEPMGGAGAPTVRYAPGGGGMLLLVGGATVHGAGDRVVILPPRRGRPAVERTGHDPAMRVARVRIRARYRGAIGLFDTLRAPLVESLDPGDPLEAAFEETLDEMVSRRPGARALAEALLRRWLIMLLRRHGARDRRCAAWLAPFEDARLGAAVTAMCERPEQSFTLPALAEAAGMSRSVFAARFAAALGQSPIEFLKSLRLERAARLLSGTDLPVKGVATRVGYASRSAFTRAFLASHGVAPATFRSACREPVARAPVPLGAPPA